MSPPGRLCGGTAREAIKVALFEGFTMIVIGKPPPKGFQPSRTTVSWGDVFWSSEGDPTLKLTTGRKLPQEVQRSYLIIAICVFVRARKRYRRNETEAGEEPQVLLSHFAWASVRMQTEDGAF